jgi:putative hemolysin
MNFIHKNVNGWQQEKNNFVSTLPNAISPLSCAGHPTAQAKKDTQIKPPVKSYCGQNGYGCESGVLLESVRSVCGLPCGSRRRSPHPAMVEIMVL